MARRAKDWNEGLAKDLRDSKFVKEFIQAALEEGLPIQVVLGKVIRAYGVKEFSKKAKIPGPNIVRAIDPRHNPTQETLNRLLRPFGLKLSVSPIDKRTKSAA
jgi:DNA-binding phage protein